MYEFSEEITDVCPVCSGKVEIKETTGTMIPISMSWPECTECGINPGEHWIRERYSLEGMRARGLIGKGNGRNA